MAGRGNGYGSENRLAKYRQLPSGRWTMPSDMRLAPASRLSGSIRSLARRDRSRRPSPS